MVGEGVHRKIGNAKHRVRKKFCKKKSGNLSIFFTLFYRAEWRLSTNIGKVLLINIDFNIIYIICSMHPPHVLHITI